VPTTATVARIKSSETVRRMEVNDPQSQDLGLGWVRDAGMDFPAFSVPGTQPRAMARWI
jgi:hypothetical protein